MIARRLKTPWQLIRVATRAAPSKHAADIAATPCALAVSMVLDRLDDQRSALRVALRNDRVMVAKDILTDIYDTEYALQVRIDLLAESDWGARLRNLMNAVAALVEAEVSRFPEEVGHVLGSRSLRSHDSWAGRLTYLAWKGRDAVSDGAAYCKKRVGRMTSRLADGRGIVIRQTAIVAASNAPPRASGAPHAPPVQKLLRNCP